MKNIFKILLGLLAINAIVGNLRQTGAISGHIVINGPRLVKTMSENLFIQFVSNDPNMNYQQIPQVQSQHTSIHFIEDDSQLEPIPTYHLPVYYQRESETTLEELFGDIPGRENDVQFLDNGETLMSTNNEFGISSPRKRYRNRNFHIHEKRRGRRLFVPAS